MNKYPGTYLSQLPTDLIRELDKYQDYVNKNYEFDKLIAKIYNYFKRHLNDEYFVADYEVWVLNVILEKYHNKSEFILDKVNDKWWLSYDKRGMQNIDPKLIQELEKYISFNQIDEL